MKTLKLIALAICLAVASYAAGPSAGGATATPDLPTISVLGSVERQGLVRVEAPTLTKVIAACGGITRVSDLKKVTCVRRKEDGTSETLSFSLESILMGKQPDPKLQEGDVIYVQERKL